MNQKNNERAKLSLPDNPYAQTPNNTSPGMGPIAEAETLSNLIQLQKEKQDDIRISNNSFPSTIR